MTVITETAALKSLCESLAHEPFITVDTEFLRDKYYYPKLCLVQIAGPETEPYAVDPLAEGIDLAPMFELFQNENVVKVFHSAKQDIEIILGLSGHVPIPLFDTQVAGMVCGFGEAASYAILVEKLAGGHKLDKSSRFTDWSQRPLTDNQVNYALSDVTYLRDVYLKLKARLEETNRERWVKEEMANLTDPATYETNPEEVWQKIRTRSHTKSFLYMVQQLAKWREEKAQEMNVPRMHLMKDQVLLQVAASAPDSYAKFSKIRGIGRMGEKGLANELLEVIAKVTAIPKEEIPKFAKPKPTVDTSRYKAILDLLKVLLKSRASDHDVAEKLIANNEHLALLAAGRADDVPCMKGWRYEIYGRDAQELISGKLGLAVKSGKIVFFEVEV